MDSFLAIRMAITQENELLKVAEKDLYAAKTQERDILTNFRKAKGALESSMARGNPTSTK